LINSGKSNTEIIEELYWTALSRAPAEKESYEAARLLEEAGDKRAALEDLTWALLNAKEFLLRN